MDREIWNNSAERQLFDYFCKRVLAQWNNDQEGWEFAQNQLTSDKGSLEILKKIGFSDERAKGILKDRFIPDPTKIVA
jgi:hypothetical protein